MTRNSHFPIQFQIFLLQFKIQYETTRMVKFINFEIYCFRKVSMWNVKSYTLKNVRMISEILKIVEFQLGHLRVSRTATWRAMWCWFRWQISWRHETFINYSLHCRRRRLNVAIQHNFFNILKISNNDNNFEWLIISAIQFSNSLPRPFAAHCVKKS